MSFESIKFSNMPVLVGGGVSLFFQLVEKHLIVVSVTSPVGCCFVINLVSWYLKVALSSCNRDLI